MAVITVSRQYGSGGDEIVARLCHLLNYTHFDKRMLAHEAAEAGLSDAEVVDASEDNYKVQGMFERIFARDAARVAAPRTWRETATGVVVAEAAPIDFDQATRFMRRAIEAAYEAGDVIIVGRGGQVILQDRPGVLHVRIEAPTPVRVAHVQKADHINGAEAQALIEQKDRAAAEYLRRYHGVDWTDAALYHLILNAARWDTESAARLIADATERLTT
jgi:cytidylate kinase